MRRGNPVAPLTFRKVELMDNLNIFNVESIDAGPITEAGEMSTRSIIIRCKFRSDDEGITKEIEMVCYAYRAEDLTIVSKL